MNVITQDRRIWARHLQFFDAFIPFYPHSQFASSLKHSSAAQLLKRDTTSVPSLHEMPWSTLSEDVWNLIFVHVPLTHRLGSCSRVNWTLYRAAAATQQITLYKGKAGVQRLPGLDHWMQQHGRHLTRLQLDALDGALTELPCPNLQELYLGDMRVQLSGSSTQPGLLHSCTRLTKLYLVACKFANGHSSLATLSSLVRLQRLTIMAVVSESTDDGGMPSTVLQHLTQLTHLYLDNADQLLNADSLQHVSCLVNLQELHLAYSTVPLSPSTTPGLSRLTALRKVRLEDVNLEPSILQDCTQLQGLELDRLAIISAGGAAALHSLLGRLQQLQSLQLVELEYDWPVAAAAYTSLTASSHLQRLKLDIDNLPSGIWPHVFPPDRQLPALQELNLGSYGEDEDEDDEDEPGPPAAAAATPGTDDLGCIISCCPGLHTISIDVQPDTNLAELAKASGLTRLSVEGLHAEGFASLRALSGLVSLQHLSVAPGAPITPQDLLRLTALTGLISLRVDPGIAPQFQQDAGHVGVLYFQVGTMLSG